MERPPNINLADLVKKLTAQLCTSLNNVGGVSSKRDALCLEMQRHSNTLKKMYALVKYVNSVYAQLGNEYVDMRNLFKLESDQVFKVLQCADDLFQSRRSDHLTPSSSIDQALKLVTASSSIAHHYPQSLSLSQFEFSAKSYKDIYDILDSKIKDQLSIESLLLPSSAGLRFSVDYGILSMEKPQWYNVYLSLSYDIAARQYYWIVLRVEFIMFELSSQQSQMCADYLHGIAIKEFQSDRADSTIVNLYEHLDRLSHEFMLEKCISWLVHSSESQQRYGIDLISVEDDDVGNMADPVQSISFSYWNEQQNNILHLRIQQNALLLNTDQPATLPALCERQIVLYDEDYKVIHTFELPSDTLEQVLAQLLQQKALMKLDRLQRYLISQGYNIKDDTNGLQFQVDDFRWPLNIKISVQSGKFSVSNVDIDVQGHFSDQLGLISASINSGNNQSKVKWVLKCYDKICQLHLLREIMKVLGYKAVQYSDVLLGDLMLSSSASANGSLGDDLEYNTCRLLQSPRVGVFELYFMNIHQRHPTIALTVNAADESGDKLIKISAHSTVEISFDFKEFAFNLNGSADDQQLEQELSTVITKMAIQFAQSQLSYQIERDLVSPNGRLMVQFRDLGDLSKDPLIQKIKGNLGCKHVIYLYCSEYLSRYLFVQPPFSSGMNVTLRQILLFITESQIKFLFVYTLQEQVLYHVYTLNSLIVTEDCLRVAIASFVQSVRIKSLTLLRTEMIVIEDDSSALIKLNDGRQMRFTWESRGRSLGQGVYRVQCVDQSDTSQSNQFGSQLKRLEAELNKGDSKIAQQVIEQLISEQ
ncbi:hypothetical protein MIR68_008287 [Amoeboaphelidium protococcarum]|nr:hypothetical protein MIR68_008287 [Amoeboaphelidium protococcarum]